MSTVTNPIFNFAVSEVAGNDAWKDMVTTVSALNLNEQTFMDQCTKWEEDFQEKTKDPETNKSAPMPGAWRSNKSVIKNALRAGIPLLREDGTPKGKTEIQGAIKEVKEEKSPEEKADIMAKTLVLFCRKHRIDIEALVSNACECV